MCPLRSDPRFEALLKDPKNNAPLVDNARRKQRDKHGGGHRRVEWENLVHIWIAPSWAEIAATQKPARTVAP